MIKQKSVVIKTALATLTYAEMGDIVCNSATDITITLPIPNSGLWYRVSNVGAGIVTVYYGSALTTLKQTEQCLCLANGTTTWFFSKGGGAMTKAEIETVLIGEISSHNHAAVYELPTGGILNQVLKKNSETDRDVAWGDVSGGGSLVINPNHVFVDNIARDNYFTTNPTELIVGIYVSAGTEFQQWNGTIWINKTLVITGPPGDQGLQGIPGSPSDTLQSVLVGSYVKAEDNGSVGFYVGNVKYATINTDGSTDLSSSSGGGGPRKISMKYFPPVIRNRTKSGATITKV